MLHNTGAYLQKIITYSVPKPNNHVENSMDLYKRLSGLELASSDTIFSLDVVSLFTNIPVELALESFSNREYIEPFAGISKSEFVQLVKFIMNSTYFTFNRKYKQCFGTPMGSPLSPIIADMVIQDLEQAVLDSLGLRIEFYFRYVDDIIIAAPKDKLSIIYLMVLIIIVMKD